MAPNSGHNVCVAIDSEALYRVLAVKLRERRVALGRTQSDLADAVGVKRTSINNIERQRQNPPLDLLYGLAEELGFRVHELLPEIHEVQKSGYVAREVDGTMRQLLPKTAEALDRAIEDLEGSEG